MELSKFKTALKYWERRKRLEEQLDKLNEAFKMLKENVEPTPRDIQAFLDKLCDDKPWGMVVLGSLMERRIHDLFDGMREVDEIMEGI